MLWSSGKIQSLLGESKILNEQRRPWIHSQEGKGSLCSNKDHFCEGYWCSFCENYKNFGHDEKNCTNKKAISFDPRYVLFNNSKGFVSVKFVGIPINGAKKNAI